MWKYENDISLNASKGIATSLPGTFSMRKNNDLISGVCLMLLIVRDLNKPLVLSIKLKGIVHTKMKIAP